MKLNGTKPGKVKSFELFATYAASAVLAAPSAGLLYIESGTLGRAVVVAGSMQSNTCRIDDRVGITSSVAGFESSGKTCTFLIIQR